MRTLRAPLSLYLAVTLMLWPTSVVADVEQAVLESPEWWLERATLESARVDDGMDLALSCRIIALAQIDLNDLAAAEKTAHRTDQIGFPPETLRADRLIQIRDSIFSSLAVAWARIGHVRAAQQALGEIHDDSSLANALVQSVEALTAGGWIEKAQKLHAASEDSVRRESGTAAIAVALAHRGRPAEARAMIDESLYGTGAGEQVMVSVVHAHARSGGFETAETLLSEISDEHLKVEAVMAIAAQRTQQGDSEGAKEFADRRDDRRGQAMALRAIGEAQFDADLVDEAWATLADAHRAAERVGDLEDRWQCCLEMGQTRRRAGDREGALASLLAAREALIPMTDPDRESEPVLPLVRITVSTARMVKLAMIAAEQARAGDEKAAATTMDYIGGGEMRDEALLVYVKGLADAGALGTAEREALRIRDRPRRCAALRAISSAAAASPSRDLAALAEWMRSLPDPATRAVVCAGAAEGLRRRPHAPAEQVSR